MPTKKKTAAPDPERYFFEVYGQVDLRGDWQGWRIRGRSLISPQGDRIAPGRLVGILFSERLRLELERKRVHQVMVNRTIMEFRARARAALAHAAPAERLLDDPSAPGVAPGQGSRLRPG